MPFPRLQKRGPIEALLLWILAEGVSRCFHAYKSVAPLKLIAWRSGIARAHLFPRLQKRGPIEAPQPPRL